ncbi:hypothetical protein FORC13_p225 (plasmid) [Bacillus cereus]|uniref:hypothetical protein n=1 Tax=Bacillus cereus TaxID=1396 RepID=UPI0007448AFB|nr:hypothetical protein [Bacillus cereus]ALZ64710.1 hypothetical protein FORC13_p225 [Bacillus cereus]
MKSIRDQGVRHAWKQERNMIIKTGKGARNWSNKRKAEIVRKGKAKGFHGHHINSVKSNPYSTANPRNIKFLTPKQHINAHKGSWRNPTKGKFIYRQSRMKKR